MSYENAQQFIARMKEDQRFRKKVQGMPSNKKLKEYLEKHYYKFDERELICAMAACMAELEQVK
jgi:predicted ribosomally synthesized peptide with nif11-like leader